MFEKYILLESIFTYLNDSGSFFTLCGTALLFAVVRVIFPQRHACHLSLTASSPTCQLLKQVTRGPWGLPVDPTLHRATDTTAVQLSEMVSLPVLIKHSVTAPLITQ